MFRRNVLIKLIVADNSGVDYVKCIASSKSGRQNKVHLGHFGVVTIGKGRYKKSFFYKKTCLGLVLTLKRIIKRVSGYYIRFSANRVLLFSQPESTIGNRLRGIISIECINSSPSKIITSARWAV